MADMIFTAVYKVYSCLSGRRFGSDLDAAFDKGYLTRKINAIMAWQFMESQHLTPVLHQLIAASSRPLRAIETTFAPDSTGFSSSRFVRWHDEKYGSVRSGRDWVKAHCMAGVKTHVVTAVEILDRDAADCPQFKPLVEKTAQNFTVKEVTADKAYLSRENLEMIHDMGGTAYIPFKSNSTAGEAGSVWEKMFFYFQLNREQFEKHYHQRSNVESVFSMMKAKFRDHVRSKTNVAMTNEVLCKVLAHNICCLIMAQLELGIEPLFWGKEEKPAEMVAETSVKAAPAERKPVAPTVPVAAPVHDDFTAGLTFTAYA